MDGAFPSGLVFDKNGNLYGPAPSSGKYGAGEIFRLRKPGKRGFRWSYAILYDFLAPPDGVGPIGYLTFDEGGNLYGVTQQGGTGPCQGGGCGTVFEFTP
jgi:hypothetical protein